MVNKNIVMKLLKCLSLSFSSMLLSQITVAKERYCLDFNDPEKVYFTGERKIVKVKVKRVYINAGGKRLYIPLQSSNVFCIKQDDLEGANIKADTSLVSIVFVTNKGLFYLCQPQRSFHKDSYERLAIVEMDEGQYNLQGLHEKNSSSLSRSVSMIFRTKKSKNVVCKRYKVVSTLSQDEE